MIESHDIKKFAKNVFSRSRGYPDKHLMHPQREWLLIIASFFIIFFVGVAHGWYQFRSHQDFADTVTVSEDVEIPMYHESVVREVHEKYQLRSEQFEDYLNQSVVEMVPVNVATSSPTTTPVAMEVEDASETDGVDEDEGLIQVEGE